MPHSIYLAKCLYRYFCIVNDMRIWEFGYIDKFQIEILVLCFSLTKKHYVEHCTWWNLEMLLFCICLCAYVTIFGQVLSNLLLNFFYWSVFISYMWAMWAKKTAFRFCACFPMRRSTTTCKFLAIHLFQARKGWKVILQENDVVPFYIYNLYSTTTKFSNNQSHGFWQQVLLCPKAKIDSIPGFFLKI